MVPLEAKSVLALGLVSKVAAPQNVQGLQSLQSAARCRDANGGVPSEYLPNVGSDSPVLPREPSGAGPKVRGRHDSSFQHEDRGELREIVHQGWAALPVELADRGTRGLRLSVSVTLKRLQ